MWFIVVCTVINNEYTLLPFSQTFLHIVSTCRASLQKFLKRKSDAYKQPICIVQHVHLQVQVGVFNCQQILTKISFVFFDIVVKRNRMWFSLVCTLIDNDKHHHSGHFDHCDVSLSIRVQTTLNPGPEQSMKSIIGGNQ